MTQSSCCVLVPIYKLNLSEQELKSLIILVNGLSSYPIRLIIKASLCDKFFPFLCILKHHGDIELISIKDCYFESVQSYNALMLSSWFYELFSLWDYVLIHQLDARLINPSALQELIYLNYDYVGGPFVVPIVPAIKPLNLCVRFYGGNGGLSLRRTSSIIKLLKNRDFYHKPLRGFLDSLSYTLMRLRTSGVKTLSLRWLFSVLFEPLAMTFGWRNTLVTMQPTSTCQEDYIFSVYAPRRFKDFRVAPAWVASAYIVDTFPELIVKSSRLPFLLGCHGWEKNSKQFWHDSLPSVF